MSDKVSVTVIATGFVDQKAGEARVASEKLHAHMLNEVEAKATAHIKTSPAQSKPVQSQREVPGYYAELVTPACVEQKPEIKFNTTLLELKVLDILYFYGSNKKGGIPGPFTFL